MSDFHRYLDALQQASHVDLINSIVSKPLRYQCHKEAAMSDVPTREEMKKEFPELYYDRQFGDVLRELRRATNKFGAFASPHEGIAIIEEEFLELREAVFWKKTPNETQDERHARVRGEAVQLAAMAIRFLVDVSDKYVR